MSASELPRTGDVQRSGTDPQRAGNDTLLRAASVAFVLALAMRTPFAAAPGYGLDQDAWLLAASARTLVEGGPWVPSRPPGYPLVELALTLFAPLGSTASNLASAALTALAAAFAAAWLARRDVRWPWALPVAAVGLPAIALPAASTLDHPWSLALLAAAFLAADGRSVTRAATIAGVCAGLACAARPPVAVVLPALAWLCHARGGRPSLARFTLCAAPPIALVVAAFLVNGEWPHADTLFSTTVTRDHILGVLGVGTFGPVGVVACLVAVALATRGGPRELPARAAGWAALLAFAEFALFPLEANYLAPALLCGALWLAPRLNPLWAVALALAVNVGGVVVPSRAGVSAGPWRRDVWAREAQATRIGELARRLEDLTPDDHVIVGPEFAAVAFILHGRGPVVHASLTTDGAARLCAAGKRVVDLTATPAPALATPTPTTPKH